MVTFTEIERRNLSKIGRRFLSIVLTRVINHIESMFIEHCKLFNIEVYRSSILLKVQILTEPSHLILIRAGILEDRYRTILLIYIYHRHVERTRELYEIPLIDVSEEDVRKLVSRLLRKTIRPIIQLSA
ncbi:MAG: hypothetical protein GXO26_03485 [Crenarchaeota archaeon]|nr:hypothetical protein [Thermoproteota archaeon]